MPKHFNEEEKIEIQRKLIDTAKDLFARYGLNKTSVQDITTASGIGKGTFYRFFKNKGELYVVAYTEEWEKVNEELEKKYKYMKGDISDIIMSCILENQKALLGHPLLAAVYDRESISVMSDQYVLNCIQKFADLTKKRRNALVESWLEANNIDCSIDVSVISGMITSVSLLNFHRDELGGELFEEVRNNIVKGIGCVISGSQNA